MPGIINITASALAFVFIPPILSDGELREYIGVVRA